MIVRNLQIVLTVTIIIQLFSLKCVDVDNQPYPQIPYPQSPFIKEINWDFKNLIQLATGSDLWPVTWAADDNIYTSWGDGGGFNGTNGDGRVSLGFARIEGMPDNFIPRNIWGGKNGDNPVTFSGKSAGMLSIDGVIYAWINMQGGDSPKFKLAWSINFGATWKLSSWSFDSGTFALGTFLNYGKDYDGARDGYVYSYGGEWGSTKNIYLCRVLKENIKVKDEYEYFSGINSSGNPTWSSNLTKRQPVFTDPEGKDFNAPLKAAVIYNSCINRYILTTSHLGTSGLGVFDSPEPWGPWTTAAYYSDWGGYSNSGESLVYSFPTKWISVDGKTLWCVFSGYDLPDRVTDSFNLVKATLTLNNSNDTHPPTNTSISVIGNAQ